MEETFKSLENKLKGVTIIVGVLSVGFTAGSYSDQLSSDEFALAMTILATLLSVVVLVLVYLKQLPTSDLSKKIELCVYAGFAVLLVIAWILFMFTVTTQKTFFGPYTSLNAIEEEFKKQRILRIIALTLQVGNILVFAWICYILFRKVKK